MKSLKLAFTIAAMFIFSMTMFADNGLKNAVLSNNISNDLAMNIIPEQPIVNVAQQAQNNQQNSFSAENAPTANNQTVGMLENGVITPDQVSQSNQINKEYDRRIKNLTKNKQVSQAELQRESDWQNEQYQNMYNNNDNYNRYRQYNDGWQRRNWNYNWNMNNCYQNGEWCCGDDDRPSWAGDDWCGGPGMMY